MTCSFFSFAFCVPDWFSLTRSKAATFSASVNRTALTGESGSNMKTPNPAMMVIKPTIRKKMRQLANLLVVKLAPYATPEPNICVILLHT
jgi:hypothetical protein